MYSLKVEPQDKSKPVIDRRLSSNNIAEIIPVAIEICKVVFNMAKPVALYMEHDTWRIFDIDKPYEYAKVIITKVSNA